MFLHAFSFLLTGSAAPKDVLRAGERRLIAILRDLDDAAVDNIVKSVRVLLAVGRHTSR